MDNDNDYTPDPLSTNLVKPWYLSKRYLGIAASIIQGALMMFLGVELTPDETNQIVTVMLGAGTAIAGAVTLYGTIKAKHQITLRKPKE